MVKKLRAELTKDAIRDAQAPERVSTSTDLLSCPVCKKRKCSYTQVLADVCEAVCVVCKLGYPDSTSLSHCTPLPPPQAQTLSGDEPMTTFAYCNECGHRWRVSSEWGRGGG